MGGEGAKHKLEPNIRTRGHLEVIISQHCACFEWSKLATWTWKNLQNAKIENFEQVPSYIEFARKS
jgi:hypothetical protein